jgi:Heparinase II/III-like protein/Heparinase II/III N-terminus
VSALTPSQLGWYARRAARMSPAEVAWRARDKARQAAWSGRQVSREQLAADAAALAAPAAPGRHRFAAVLPPQTAALVPAGPRAAVLAAADRLLRGEWEVLGVLRTDLARPDWFTDPVTGQRAPADRYAFRINHRSQAQTGNVKQVWEISRLQHLTLLATAWFLSQDEAYACRVAQQLRSWWRENPFLSGVHWTSGIEVGLRLISLAWIRRLLDGWPGAPSLFEHDGLAVRQIEWHQRYLAAFVSRGSSANNHVIAEAAGQLVASCAFPWSGRSDRWRRSSARLLERELLRNTFGSGIGRELATGYQCFVAELGLLAAVEAGEAGHPVSPACWQRLCAMVDSGAALLDERLRPPRQGDGDDGLALLLDAPAGNRWPSLLALGAALFGRLDWWPRTQPDARSSIISAMSGASRELASASREVAGTARTLPEAARAAAGRPAARPWRFADAGLTLLRTNGQPGPEIWCRCDGGPHGYLSIAAHAHADALSVELRYGGVDVLADPGTYCYHGEQAWRSYFRSTIGHNTVEIGGRSQSGDGGPFLWLRHANARELDVRDLGETAEWTAEHDGYSSLSPPARHRRRVRLDRAARTVQIRDEISGGSYPVRAAFHLGPEVEAELDGSCATLRWPGGPAGGARLELPASLAWRLHRGETDPVLGWYSAGLGHRVPAFTLIGTGQSEPGTPLLTRLDLAGTALTAGLPAARPAVSWCASGSLARGVPGSKAEAG